MLFNALSRCAVAALALFAIPAVCQGPDLNTGTQASYNVRALVLNVHNAYRKQHHATNLMYNFTIAKVIQAAVNKCPDGDPPVAQGYSYGENWYGFYISGAAINFTQKSYDGVRAWGDERQYYNYSYPDNSGGHDVGHFTQVVWNSTRSVGCAWSTVTCASPHWQNQLLCGYYPPGNVIWGGSGDRWRFYRTNVLRP